VDTRRALPERWLVGPVSTKPCILIDMGFFIDKN